MKITALEETKENLNQTLRNQQQDADKIRSDYNSIKEELENKRREYNRISNEKNHSDERQRQLQEEVNALEVKENNYKMVLKQLDNMSFMDRVLGRYPDDIKALKG